MGDQRVRIIVACHKQVPRPITTSGYLAICNLGVNGERAPGFGLYDDLGFPRANQTYCELSALRAFQRTGVADNDVIGLVHYRRVFALRARAGVELYNDVHQIESFDWAAPERFGAGAMQLAAALDGSDWASVPRIDIRKAGQPHLLQAWLAAHPSEFLEIAERAVSAVSPSTGLLRDYMRESTGYAPFNMFVGSGSALGAYTDFLWPVLERCVAEIGLPDDPYQRRYAGFIAERLHGYWIDLIAAERGLRTTTLPVALLDRGLVKSTDTGEVLDMRRPVDRIRYRWPLRVVASARIRAVQSRRMASATARD
jgi:hypothetical protein